MIFSIDQNNIFKSFSKKDLDRIVHLALFHLVLLKPLGLGYYLFGILRLPQDQAIEMVGQQIMGQLFAALLLYMPLSRIIDDVLSRGAVLEDDTNHTV